MLAVVAFQPHKLKVGGSSPSRATIFYLATPAILNSYKIDPLCDGSNFNAKSYILEKWCDNREERLAHLNFF